MTSSSRLAKISSILLSSDESLYGIPAFVFRSPSSYSVNSHLILFLSREAIVPICLLSSLIILPIKYPASSNVCLTTIELEHDNKTQSGEVSLNNSFIKSMLNDKIVTDEMKEKCRNVLITNIK